MCLLGDSLHWRGGYPPIATNDDDGITKISQYFRNANESGAIRKKLPVGLGLRFSKRRCSRLGQRPRTNEKEFERNVPMKPTVKLTITISVLLLAAGTALPALAATHLAQANMAPHRSIHSQATNRSLPPQYRDGYNARASAPAMPQARTTPTRNDMPAGWKCVPDGFGDRSAFPAWEMCEGK